MTQELDFSRNEGDPPLSSREASDEEEDIASKDRTSVREMIMRFEKTNIANCLRDSSESLNKSKDLIDSFTSVVNPIQTHFLNPVTKCQDRNSNMSVNSILSNASENSCGSSSSGFISDRKSGVDFLVPHRPAPPPPVLSSGDHTPESNSPPPPATNEGSSTERRFSFTTPNSSPVVARRTRQPPVMRKKSSAGSQGHLKGDTLWSFDKKLSEDNEQPKGPYWLNDEKTAENQETLNEKLHWPYNEKPVNGLRHLVEGEKHWSYGVKQSDLEKLLRLKRSEPSDNEEETNLDPNVTVVQNDNVFKQDSDTSSNDLDSDNNSEGKEYVINVDDCRIDAISTDHSTDTLIDEERNDGDDDLSDASEGSDVRCNNYDNVSIKSISSFDMIPYQTYDSITVSSDEFGSEVCHAPDSEFLTVSAVNEWCVSKSTEPVLIPVESKKEKYRRRLTERVNELLHTEHVYVDRLRHVVEDYIPEMNRKDIPPTFKALKPDIFSNIERIFRFHSEEFLPALRDCENDLRKLGQCFRRFEKRFNMYVMYSRNNKKATRLVFEHKPFFQERQFELGDRLDLSSYLLEPVQRIPRYKLFLADLVKTYTNYENERCESDSRISKLSVDSDETGGSNGESSENEETPLESLKQAKSMIECVLTAVDEIMALENVTDCPHYLNLLNQGRLLRQNEFYAMDTARRRRQLMRIFLFDKLVLITAVYRKQPRVEYFIYKDHISVDDLGITAKEQDMFKFTIWYKKRNLKSYKLETSEPSVRHAWVEEITSLLWEQAMQKKELIQQQRNKRISVVSMNSQESEGSSERNDDKYNSLRGVPGEVRRCGEKKSRRTTWYCE